MKNKLKLIVSVVAGLLAGPVVVYAVVQSLNGQTGQTQTFSNDSNITIGSSADVHTLGWSGLLPVSRGGTGTGSFISGSVLFMGSGKVSESNQNFFWDNTNRRLGIGVNSPVAPVHLMNNTASPEIYLEQENLGGGWKIGNLGNDGGLHFISRQAETDVTAMAMSYDGIFSLRNNVGNNVYLTIGNFSTSSVSFGILNDESDTFLISAGDLGENEMLRLQYASGASFSSNIEVSGHGKFEAEEKSTIYVGSSVKSGCIVLGDSDGSGVTYITADNGVLTASTSKPNTCQ